MAKHTHYSDVDIGSIDRERLEDYALSDSLTTAGGLELVIALVCDGVGSSEWGIRASRDAALYVVDYIRDSKEKHIPELLTQAITRANKKIYDTIPDGNTTIALAVVHVTHNKLYVASVGDSPIFLIRNNQLLRLNTDHNVENESVWNKAIPQNFENPKALTRALGADTTVQVDIGLYLEPNLHPQQAQAIGENGLVLQDGDSILVMSDGMTSTSSKNHKETVVSEKEFLRHALDNDIRLAGRSLLSYAKSRSPQDNLGLAMIFVDGNQRRFVSAPVRLTSAQKWLMLVAIGLTILTISILVLSLMTARQEQAILVSTQTKLVANLTLAVTTTNQNDLAVLTVTPSSTINLLPTATLTDTPSPTETSTPTVTLTPTLPPSPTPLYEVGRVFVAGTGQSLALFEGNFLQASTAPIWARIDGGIFTLEASNLYLQNSTSLLVGQVSRDDLNVIELSMNSAGSTFIQTGKYHVKTIFDETVVFEAQENSCIGIQYLSKDDVSLSCLEGSACHYTVGNAVDEVLPLGNSLSLSLTSSSISTNPSMVTFDESKHYFDIVNQLVDHTGVPSCLMKNLDQDGDSVFDDVDRCVAIAGLVDFAGCPNTDNDSFSDMDDACPLIYAETVNGCPNTPTPTLTATSTLTPTPTSTPTATPTLAPIIPDRDRDGVPDREDSCPNYFGTMINGCRADGCCTG